VTSNFIKIFNKTYKVSQGLKWGGSAPPLKWALPPRMWAPPPIKMTPSPSIIVPSFPWAPIWSKATLVVGYCIFVSVSEIQVLWVGVRVLLASRLFHGLDPAVAKALITDIHQAGCRTSYWSNEMSAKRCRLVHWTGSRALRGGELGGTVPSKIWCGGPRCLYLPIFHELPLFSTIFMFCIPLTTRVTTDRLAEVKI
jgi:hypothetical protein